MDLPVGTQPGISNGANPNAIVRPSNGNGNSIPDGSDTSSPTSSTITPASSGTSTITPSGSAFISTRLYIYHLPYPLPPNTPIPYSPGLPSQNPLNLPTQTSEPTSTLVLTMPSGIFVDVRIFKPANTSEPELPNEGGPMTRLEWAFAGRSLSYPKPGAGEGVRHSKWEHWVDSKYPVGAETIPVDEGDMYPMSDPNLTLEWGNAFNPQLQTRVAYEEMWQDEAINTCVPDTSKFAIALMLDDVPSQVRGMVVRVGQYVQGILKIGDSIGVERWEYAPRLDNNGIVVGGNWERKVKLGNAFLPCAACFKPERLEQGTKLTFGQHVWDVEEKVVWVEE